MKSAERAEAIRLRRDGESIKAIARRLDVSTSSVSRWVRGVALTEAQRERLRRNVGMHDRQVRARETRAAAFRAERAAAQADGRLYARAGDPLHAAGCMLYWAEGTKTPRQVRIANSDPELLRVFLRFVSAYFVVPGDRVRVTVHLFADHAARRAAIEGFWLEQLGLTRASLLPSVVNVYSLRSTRKRASLLPHGTCHLCISRTAIVQHILGAIQEYGRFERPEWLDGLSLEARRARS